ncbi:MAG: hypothetical protein QG641_2085, partial [Candidatus Poribacteria bacterium]|nr:hypothetical protein [Candidatus Poribacteria bacterium]
PDWNDAIEFARKRLKQIGNTE